MWQGRRVDAGRTGEGANDADLVRRANAGDEQAFEILYRRHRDWAAAVARRFTPPSEVPDVVQEVFISLFRKFPGFVLTGTIKGYLYPAIKHVSISRARRQRPTVPVDDLPEIFLASTEAPAASPDVTAALRHLGPLQQEVLLLRFVDDLSLAQIAEALRIPIGTAKSRLHNAIEQIRQSVGEKKL